MMTGFALRSCFHSGPALNEQSADTHAWGGCRDSFIHREVTPRALSLSNISRFLNEKNSEFLCPFFPIWVGWFTFSPPLRIHATRRGSPVQSRDSHLNKKGEIKSCSAILTVVAIDESSMGRRGLMEVIFQGVREVGSGVGNTGPIRSLESIKDPRWLMEKIKMCVIKWNCQLLILYMRWSKSLSGQSLFLPCFHIPL